MAQLVLNDFNSQYEDFLYEICSNENVRMKLENEYMGRNVTKVVLTHSSLEKLQFCKHLFDKYTTQLKQLEVSMAKTIEDMQRKAQLNLPTKQEIADMVDESIQSVITFYLPKFFS